jgi:putative peptide zinc metalloprotease protein
MSTASSWASPLSSAQWHRLAQTRPRLAEHVAVTRLCLRGQRWHVLQDTRTGQSCRLNASAYDIAARLNGQASLQALWEALEARWQPDVAVTQAEPPTQDEVMGVVRQLHQHRLLSFDDAPDFGDVNLSDAAMAAAAAAPDSDEAAPQPHGPPRNTWMNWRVPLLDPTRHEARTWPLAHAVMSMRGLWLWSALMLALLLGMLMNAAPLQAHAATWMQTPRYLWLAALCYPIMKALHEAAHALAVQRWGGKVREAGISFMMFMPVPYVDASAAQGFAQTWQRALVSGAGIMTELALASVGLWCWLATDPGWLHDIGFVTWTVGCLSTLLFNANPLQRFDGYHALTDALHLPNLAQRSRQWWQQRANAWLRGTPAQHDISVAPHAPGEAPWLVGYAPLSWLYQLGVLAGLAWWLGGIHSLLGWLMGALAVWSGLVQPGRRWLSLIGHALLWSAPGQHGVRHRAAALLALPLLLCLPWPDRTVTQGVVWAPDDALVRPEVDGIVQAVHVKDGETVQPGQLLVSLHNPKLNAEHERISAQLAQAEQGTFAYLNTDASKAGQAGDQAQRWQVELQRVQEQISALQVRAHRAGRLVLPRTDDLPGRYLRRGELLGHVLNHEPTTVRVAVPDGDVAMLRDATRGVSVALAGPSTTMLTATLMRDSVGATKELPSAALSTDMGGHILTDPQDEHHTKALRPVVVMDVKVTGASHTAMTATQGERRADWLGQRAWVRFDQGWAPLPWQAWRWVQRRAMVDFNPQH